VDFRGVEAIRRRSFPLFHISHFTFLTAETRRYQDNTMNDEPKLRYDLWHLLGLIARRKEAGAAEPETWNPDRELVAGKRPGTELADRILNGRTLSRRYQEAMELHTVAH